MMSSSFNALLILSFALFFTEIYSKKVRASSFIDKYFTKECGSGLQAHFIDCYFSLDGATTLYFNFGFEADYRLERRNERTDIEGVYYSNAF